MLLLAATADAQGITPTIRDLKGVGTVDIAERPSIVWTDLGYGLPGENGIPLLEGKGLLAPDSATEVRLSQALPLAPSVVFVSFQAQPTPFKGGYLVPVPTALEVPLVTNREGGFLFAFAWPKGIPAGTDIVMQVVVADAAAPSLFALSNALMARPLRL